MAITKTGNLLTSAGKAIFSGGKSLLKPVGKNAFEHSKSLVGPLGLGLTAMSVSSGTNSLGGEAAGATTGLVASNMASNAMKAVGLGKLSLIGSAIGGMYGYSKGSELANKHMPIYKRGGTTTSGSPSYANTPAYEQ